MGERVEGEERREVRARESERGEEKLGLDSDDTASR